MNIEYLERLISGELLGGFLHIVENEGNLRIPGYIKLSAEGQISVRLVLEEGSSVFAGLEQSLAISVNGNWVSPQEIPKVCFLKALGSTYSHTDSSSTFFGAYHRAPGRS